MVLDLIKRETEYYKHVLVSGQYGELYKWEALKNFHDNWNIDADDFKIMFDKSFQSRHNNLWANPHWFPKPVMLRFIEHDRETVRKMFLELFDETGNIENRIERFVYHCDKLLEEVNRLDNRVKNHFHDGQRIVSLYLAFRFPDKYAIYKFKEFKTFMEIVKAKDIPGTGEYERFFKVVRTLYNILTKDEELMKFHQQILNVDCYQNKTLMLAQDFIFVIARHYIA